MLRGDEEQIVYECLPFVCQVGAVRLDGAVFFYDVITLIRYLRPASI